MFETEAELAELQSLLDASLAGATEHLRSIVTPGQRTLTAAQVTAVCRGMCTLAISTVTANGEPRDQRGRRAPAARPLVLQHRARAPRRPGTWRPGRAVSVAYIRGEEVGVFTHGRAEPLNPAGGPDDPDWPALLQYMTDYYGSSPLGWGDVVYYRLRPHWMVAFASNPGRADGRRLQPGGLNAGRAAAAA